jgi:hypothetical protein
MPIDHCDIAKQAIRSAFLAWGTAWTKADKETRRAYIAMAIVDYMSGRCCPYNKGWDEVRDMPWTAKDVREALEICEAWSETGGEGRNLGVHLIRMAARDESDPDDPILRLEKYFRSIYG